jgi:hypothetical protein
MFFGTVDMNVAQSVGRLEILFSDKIVMVIRKTRVCFCRSQRFYLIDVLQCVEIN